MFISHRGPDTKLGLVGNMLSRLQRCGLHVFMDADLEPGDVAWDTIQAKLRGARTVLLVLSPKFQTSWWCVNRLPFSLAATSRVVRGNTPMYRVFKSVLAGAHTHCRRCMEELRIAAERREHVLPIFCDVEPGTFDRGSLKRSYFAMRSDLPESPADTLQRWVDALTWVRGVSGITGWRHDSASKCAYTCTDAQGLLIHSCALDGYADVPCVEAHRNCNIPNALCCLAC